MPKQDCIIDACSYIYLHKIRFLYNGVTEITPFDLLDKIVNIKYHKVISDEIKRNFTVSEEEALKIKGELMSDVEKEEIIENSLSLIEAYNKNSLDTMKSELFVLKISAKSYKELNEVTYLENKISNLEHTIEVAKNVKASKDVEKMVTKIKKEDEIKSLKSEIASLKAYSDYKSKKKLLQMQTKLIILRSS